MWDYFDIEDDESVFATCKFCKKKISRGGKSSTTSNLNKHLNSFHTSAVMKHKKSKLGLGSNSRDDLINDGEDDCLEDRPNSSTENADSFAVPLSVDVGLGPCSASSSPCSSPSPSISPRPRYVIKRKPPLSQPTLTAVLDKRAKFKFDDPRAKAITKKIIEMICIDGQPFSMVEDKGFKSLINHLEPRYEIPSRTYFSKTELPRLYDKTKQTVNSLLQQAKHISVTTDMWTSTSNDDYMSITAHFFTEENVWTHVCLEVIPFPEVGHTGEAISEFLASVLTDWNIKSELHVVVRDNGKNVVAAMNCGRFTGIPCLAHTLQLVVKDGVLYQRNVSNLTSVCRKLVGHFKHSAKACKILKAAQQTLKLPEHKLIQDEPTRWNSTKHMMDRLLEQRRAISFAAPELKLPVELNTNDWELMEILVKLLKVFDDATFQCSSSNTSISEVIPIVNSAVKELQSYKNIHGVKNLVTDLLTSIEKRFSDLEEIRSYSLATLLDPRLKGSVFLRVECLESAKAQLIEEAQEMEVSNISSRTAKFPEPNEVGTFCFFF